MMDKKLRELKVLDGWSYEKSSVNINATFQ